MAESELTTIARPYARAAFSEALDVDTGLERWSRMLEMLAALVSHEKVEQGLDDPRLTSADKAEMLVALADEALNEQGRNFVHLLTEHDRVSLLPTISTLYELLKASHQKTMDVDVASAFEVSDEELNNLTQALSRMLQREVHLESRVDPSLIGGVVIKAEDTVIDNSVLGKLERLGRALN